MNWREDLGLDKPHHKKPIRVPRPRSPQVEVSDSFAPYSGLKVCKDGAGYWRPKHEYLIDSRDGLRCVYCRDLLRMEPY